MARRFPRVSPGVAFRFSVAATICLALAAPGAAAASPAGPFPFPVKATQLWLSADEGTVAGAPGPGPLLVPSAPAGPTADLPLIPALEQLGLGVHENAWYGATAWNATREVVGDVTVDLHFFLSVEATARLRVQLDGVAPDGTLTTLGAQDQKESVQDLLPHTARFTLPADGARLAKGHNLRLLVSVDDVAVLTWLQYGSPAAPASLTLHHRLADGDRDGIPDDADPCPTEPDCDGNGQPDGGQVVHYSNATHGPTTVNNHGGGGGGSGGGNGGGGTGGGSGAPGNGTGPVTFYEFYLNGQEPPVPPPGSGQGEEPSAPASNNLELVGGGGIGLVGLLVAAAGLFGRHPL